MDLQGLLVFVSDYNLGLAIKEDFKNPGVLLIRLKKIKGKYWERQISIAIPNLEDKSTAEFLSTQLTKLRDELDEEIEELPAKGKPAQIIEDEGDEDEVGELEKEARDWGRVKKKVTERLDKSPATTLKGNPYTRGQEAIGLIHHYDIPEVTNTKNQFSQMIDDLYNKEEALQRDTSKNPITKDLVIVNYRLAIQELQRACYHICKHYDIINFLNQNI